MLAYQADKLGKSHGFTNYGSTCYFNTLIQSLLSCPALRQALEQAKQNPIFARCQVARCLLNIWEQPEQADKLNLELLACIFARNERLRGGQQDVSEAFLTLLDLLECLPEVYQLFQHRYQTQIFCLKCSVVVSKVDELGTIFQIQPDLNSGQSAKFAAVDPTYNRTASLNDFLLKVNNSTDKDFKCPKCSERGEKFKTTMLQMVPEILPVLLKKYEEKSITDFPEFLEFPSATKKTKLIYQLVAQSEHSGTRHGGHYWAVCRRGEWQTFNDTHVSAGQSGPRATTYMLWYCYTTTQHQ